MKLGKYRNILRMIIIFDEYDDPNNLYHNAMIIIGINTYQ